MLSLVVVLGVLVVAVLLLAGVFDGDEEIAAPLDLTPAELAASLAGTYRLVPESVVAAAPDPVGALVTVNGAVEMDASGVLSGAFSYTYELSGPFGPVVTVDASVIDSSAPVVTVAGGDLYVSAFVASTYTVGRSDGGYGNEEDYAVSGTIDAATGILELGRSSMEPLRFVRIP